MSEFIGKNKKNQKKTPNNCFGPLETIQIGFRFELKALLLLVKSQSLES